jgi:ABC-2 type transport system ATP-binding protein
MSTASGGVVVLKELTVTIGSKIVLQDMSHVFPLSSVTAILGANGAGKTTLLRTLVGVVRPQIGGAFVWGFPAGSIEAKSRIAYLAEQPGLYERISAYDNLVFHAKLRGIDGVGVRKEASSLLKEYGLEDYTGVAVRKFSKGMRQRLALARTFLGRPPVLLLDEPTSGLDPDGSKLAISMIKEYARGGATVLMSTHNAYLARQVSDIVLLLKDGMLAATGPFDEVLKPYRKVKVTLLTPSEAGTIFASLRGFHVELNENPIVSEFEVQVVEKRDIPQLIKAIIQGGLQPLSVEPGEITYDHEAE